MAVPDEEEEGSQDEMGCIGTTRGGESQGEVAVVGERNHGSELGDEEDNPVPESVKKGKTKPWETVDDLRALTSPGAKFLQNLAAISEQGRMDALMLLQDRLSLLTSSDIPQTPSLEFIIKRCMVTNAQVMEDQFRHMIALMQLVLWLEQ